MVKAEGLQPQNDFAAIQEIMSELPLSDCIIERDTLTGILMWKAPSGFGFKVSGQFTESNFAVHGEDIRRPEDSVDKLKAENAELYSKCLKRARGNHDRAFSLLIDELEDRVWGYEGEFEPAETFIGRFLAVYPNFDGSPVLPGYEVGEQTRLMVMGDLDVWYEKEGYQQISDLAPDSDTVTGVLFKSNRAAVRWSRDMAEVVPGKSKIEVVGMETEENQELLLPNPPKAKGIEKPIWSGKIKREILEAPAFKMPPGIRDLEIPRQVNEEDEWDRDEIILP